MTPRRSVIPVFVPHLGCPHRCVFCDQRRISGALRPARPEDVVRAIEEGLSRLKPGTVPTLAFYGGSFTAIPLEEQKALLGAARPYLEAGKIRDIRLSTRPDAIDGGILALLRAYGVRTVELGVQSMDEEVLRLARRGHTPEDAERAARAVRDAGFELILQMMTGLPGDTPEKSLETARRFVALRPHGVRIYPTVVIRDTPLFDLWRAGAYREHTVEDATKLCAALCEIFDDAGISVIRLGLNPTEELSHGGAVAGAYHPALGELVLARRYLTRERALLSEADRGKEVLFAVSPGRISAATGQKRENCRILQSEFALSGVKFVQRDIPDLTVERVMIS